MKEGIEEYLQREQVDTRPIEGFRVMEWLRGVRDANYALSINDPAAYSRRRRRGAISLIIGSHWMY